MKPSSEVLEASRTSGNCGAVTWQEVKSEVMKGDRQNSRFLLVTEEGCNVRKSFGFLIS